MQWKPFEYNGKTFDLSHVHPFEWEYTAPAADKRPERTYRMIVQFSMHTFTRGIEQGEGVETAMIYRDEENTKEERAFDFLRYELSNQLPDIIRGLGEKACYHTHHGNFFTIEATAPNGVASEYEVYFQLSRAKGKGEWLHLYIQSAYVRDKSHGTTQPRKRKIRFQVIAHNIIHGKAIKAGR